MNYVETVAAMRAAQKRYFKDHTQQALVESKRLEKDVDDWTTLLLATPTDWEQPVLEGLS